MYKNVLFCVIPRLKGKYNFSTNILLLVNRVHLTFRLID